MAVDLLCEEYLSIREVADQLKKNPSTVWRWVLHGVRGVKLETNLIGGRRYANRVSISRFLNKLNGIDEQVRIQCRQQQIRRAEVELRNAGI